MLWDCLGVLSKPYCWTQILNPKPQTIHRLKIDVLIQFFWPPKARWGHSHLRPGKQAPRWAASSAWETWRLWDFRGFRSRGYQTCCQKHHSFTSFKLLKNPRSKAPCRLRPLPKLVEVLIVLWYPLASNQSKQLQETDSGFRVLGSIGFFSGFKHSGLRFRDLGSIGFM